MPLPHAIARLNKRYTNWLIEPALSLLPGFIIVEHCGRQSGIAYETPLYGFRIGSTIGVALTYGPAADWTKNVMANGGSVRRNGELYPIVTAAIGTYDEVQPELSLVVRSGLRVLKVRHFMLLTTADADEAI